MMLPVKELEMAENLSWLGVAFGIGWLIIFLYLFRISRKERDLRRRVAVLEGLLRDE
jgi:CcmD family protein